MKRAGNRIKMVTSIAPKNIENQKQALQSWMENGFDIISCNVRDEIEQIESEFPQVEFVEVKRDGRALMGKPCPYIYDMLQVLKEKADDICGIVNSDIHLCNFSQAIYDSIWEETHQEIHFIRRNDIERLEDVKEMDYDMFFGGIDVFFFKKRDIECIEDDGLLMGQAMWDYWLPIMFCENGKVIKEILNPIIFHVKHALGWNDDITAELSWKICRKHFCMIAKEDSVIYLKEKFFRIISKPDLGKCFVSEDISKKKVLILCKPEFIKKYKKDIIFQTHKNIELVKEIEVDKEYDYAVNLPHDITLSHSFVDTIIWVMETFRKSMMHVMPYAMGNQSATLGIGNCCNIALKRLKNELDDICVWKRDARTEEKVSLCSTCICSIGMEEDERIIWEREGFCGKVLIYPAGDMARTWVRRYRAIATKVEIVGFVDGMEKKKNTFVDGIPVFSPEIVLQQDRYDRIVIISNIYQEEIYEMLKQKVPEEKLIIWNEYSRKNIGKAREG